MKPIPESVEALLAELEELYPPRCILPEERLEDAHRYAGSVDLVSDLRRRYIWTREHALPKELLNVRRNAGRSSAR